MRQADERFNVPALEARAETFKRVAYLDVLQELIDTPALTLSGLMAKLQMYIEFKTPDEGWQERALDKGDDDGEPAEIGDTETALLAAVERDLLRMISEAA